MYSSCLHRPGTVRTESSASELDQESFAAPGAIRGTARQAGLPFVNAANLAAFPALGFILHASIFHASNLGA